MATPEPVAPHANLSVLDGVSFMVGVVIGIGIFKTPPLVAANVGSEWAFIGVWLLGGAITLVGALCYAELAAAYPNAGGEYHFLQRAFGRPVSLMFAWARGTVIQTGAIAAVAFVLGDYAAVLVPLGANGPAIYAVLSIVVFTGVNMAGTLQSKAAQVMFTTLTVAAVLVVVVAGFLAEASAAPAAAAASNPAGAVGLAMVLVLLTYGGWNEAAYLSAELRDVRRNMIRVLLIGTIILTVIYTLVNLAYLRAFGLDGLRGSGAVAADLLRLVAGDAGALVLSVVVVCAALSTLNGTIFTGARVYYALGRDVPALQRLGVWDGRGDNPRNALLLQGVIALALVLFGAATRDGFQAMVDYTAPVFWLFLLLVGVSLFVLRRREPDRERPFRVPLYPLTPLLFCLTCGYLLYASLAYTGVGALVGLGVLVAGTPLLLIRRKEESPPLPAA